MRKDSNYYITQLEEYELLLILVHDEPGCFGCSVDQVSSFVATKGVYVPEISMI